MPPINETQKKEKSVTKKWVAPEIQGAALPTDPFLLACPECH